jgi:hypothetical protein
MSFGEGAASFGEEGTGNASSSTSLGTSPDANPGLAVDVSLPDITSAAVDSSVSIPIKVEDLTGLGVSAYDLQITYDPTVIQPLRTPYDTTDTLSSGMLITPNAANAGHLIISAFQTGDLSGAGTLLNVRFKLIGGPGRTGFLKFEDYTDPNNIFHPGFSFPGSSGFVRPWNVVPNSPVKAVVYGY